MKSLTMINELIEYYNLPIHYSFDEKEDVYEEFDNFVVIYDNHNKMVMIYERIENYTCLYKYVEGSFIKQFMYKIIKESSFVKAAHGLSSINKKENNFYFYNKNINKIFKLI